jgi:NADP-dependent 3-hydroxy acid dehydrogenase YdfG
MTLKNKNAVIDRAGGAGGGAGARAFALEGAKVLLMGSHLASVDKISKGMPAARFVAQAADVEVHA